MGPPRYGSRARSFILGLGLRPIPTAGIASGAERTAHASDVTTRLAFVVAVLLVLGLAAPPARGAMAGQTANAARTLREERAEQRLLAGHLLRRLGFGPARRDMQEILRSGRDAYLELQLHPERVDNRIGERRFLPEPGPQGYSSAWLLRWITRMTFSRRQLEEKMTLLWHEHFATSIAAVGSYVLLHDQENMLRRHALGNFRDLLIGITKDNAMLIYLNNNANDGQLVDEQGERVPPNENYARELLQLFALGVHQLNMDGALVLDAGGIPVPAYSETDVKEIARALSGWYARVPSNQNFEDPTERIPPARFEPDRHDSGAKTVLGEVIPADAAHPEADVERVVDILMRQPTTAPFIAKELILKLATETPSPDYVRRVAEVFAASGGDIRATVRAILTDAEFYSPAVVRSQHKTPIEHVIGAMRGLGTASGRAAIAYSLLAELGHAPYVPPSVFSFYRPGLKGALVNATSVALRDQAADTLVSDDPRSSGAALWDAGAMLRRQRLSARPPAPAVDRLAADLLAAPLSAATRQVVLDYIGPRVTEEKLRGAAWLIMCAPEYQVN
jgi:uncharacterized protein (DUF1800 family)